MRRELENTAKDMGEKVRSGRAVSEEYFELGVVMLRKKSFTQVCTNDEYTRLFDSILPTVY